MTLNARPHSNGNSRSDFVDAYKALNAAHESLSQALRLVRCNITHGRNYQHIGSDAAGARDDDLRLIGLSADSALAGINALLDSIAVVLVSEPR